MNVLISDFQKKYGNLIALEIDRLRIDSGEIVGLLGNNGAGKSTFIKGILDLIRLDTGTVLLDDSNNIKSDSWKSKTSSFLGNDFLIDFLTPLEYFRLIGDLYGLSSSQVDEKISRHTDFFDPYANKEKRIRDLSSGNRQKAGILGALIPESTLMLFDEPYVYLDPSAQLRLTEIFKQLKEERKTVIISSHDYFYLNEYCTRLVFIMNGRIVKDANAAHCPIESMKSFFETQ